MRVSTITKSGLILLVLCLVVSSILLHRRVSGTIPGREDVYLSWKDGVRIAEGDNPYSRIHSGDMTKNESYPTYLPAFYVFSAGLYQLGVSDLAALYSYWRPIGE